MEIAEAAGISQAYLFRLFPTKVDLFVAAADEGSRRMLATFREASEQAPGRAATRSRPWARRTPDSWSAIATCC